MDWNLDVARILKQFTFDVGFLAILFVLSLWLFNGKRRKLLPIALSVVFSLVIFFCAKGTPQLLSSWLKGKAAELAEGAERSQCLETFDTMVLLAGGLQDRNQPSPSSLSRILTAAEFLRQKEAEKRRFNIIIAGGVTEPEFGVSESEVIAQYLERFVTPGYHRIALEKESLTTYQNSLGVKKILDENRMPARVILVTSEAHMPRAAATFVTQGMRVCALRATSFDLDTSGLLAFANGANTVSVLNEYFGFAGYWARGWIGRMPQLDSAPQ